MVRTKAFRSVVCGSGEPGVRDPYEPPRRNQTVSDVPLILRTAEMVRITRDEDKKEKKLILPFPQMAKSW